MNKKNLIYLGALAQRKFEMKDDFEIMEVVCDAPKMKAVG